MIDDDLVGVAFKAFWANGRNGMNGMSAALEAYEAEKARRLLQDEGQKCDAVFKKAENATHSNIDPKSMLPTAQLRWHNGVLQQAWRSEDRSLTQWHDVPQSCTKPTLNVLNGQMNAAAPKPKTRTMWANLYSDGGALVYTTEEKARNLANRAAIRIAVPVEVPE